MIQVNRLCFTILHPNGQVEELFIDADRALVGSGAYCEVRLSPEDAAAEVLLVEEQNGGLYVEVRSFNPAPKLNGIDLARGRLHEGSVVQIGRYQLQAKLSQTTLEGFAKSQQSGSSFGSTMISGLLVVAGAFMVLSQSEPSSDMPEAPPVPLLWAAERETEQCQQRAAGPADALAAEHLLKAEGRRERAPFYFQDGVVAVSLFERAAACFEVAGNQEAAKEATGAASALRGHLKSDFHIHQVRLERALATEAYEAARREAQILQSFLQGRKEDYVTWLASLDRMLELKFAGRKEE